jgi:hypothetical protein
MTIKVCVDGALKFAWEGNEAAIADILSEFPKTAQEVGETPVAMADVCISRLGAGDLPKLEDEEAKELMMTAVIWRVLTIDAPPECGGGTIGDHAAWRNLRIDFFTGFDGKEFYRSYNVYWDQ